MQNITHYVIDDINNFILSDQHLTDDIEVFKQGEVFKVYLNENEIFSSYSPTRTTEYLLTNFIVTETN